MDSMGNNIAFSWNGELYYILLLVESHQGQSTDYRRLHHARSGVQDHHQQSHRLRPLAQIKREISVIVRGDVFVTNNEYGTTKRVTNTPQQERDLTWAPTADNWSTLQERHGQWNFSMKLSWLVRAIRSLPMPKSLRSSSSPMTLSSFQPVFSPDGKEIAFLRDRSAIYVLNLVIKAEREVMNKIPILLLRWRPRLRLEPVSKWIILRHIGIGGWNNIAIIKADGSGTFTTSPRVDTLRAEDDSYWAAKQLSCFRPSWIP